MMSVNEIISQDYKTQIAQFDLTDIVQKINKLTFEKAPRDTAQL